MGENGFCSCLCLCVSCLLAKYVINYIFVKPSECNCWTQFKMATIINHNQHKMVPTQWNLQWGWCGKSWEELVWAWMVYRSELSDLIITQNQNIPEAIWCWSENKWKSSQSSMKRYLESPENSCCRDFNRRIWSTALTSGSWKWGLDHIVGHKTIRWESWDDLWGKKKY